MLRLLLVIGLLPLLFGLSSVMGQNQGFDRIYQIPSRTEAIGITVLEEDSSYLLQTALDTNKQNNWGRSMQFIRLDKKGDTLQTSPIIGGGTYDYWNGLGDGLIEAPDSGYYMVGAFNDSSSNSAAMLYRIGPDLDTLWTRSYGGNDTLFEMFDGILPLDSGQFLIYGQKEHETYGDWAWFLKVDSFGNVLWSRKTGADHDGRFSVYSMRRTFDGGFILAGALSSWYPNGNDFSSGWIAKLNGNGNKKWDRLFMGDYGYTMFGVGQREDSTFITGGLKANDAVGGNSEMTNGVTRKYSRKGDLLWEKEYPPDRTPPQDKNDGIVRDAYQTEEGGMVLGGFLALNPVSNPDSTRLGWVLKTRPDGELLWKRSFSHHELGEHKLWKVREVENEMILAVGSSRHPDTTNNRASPWLLKLDSMGCVSSGCRVGLDEKEKAPTSGFTLYPNPNDGRFKVRSEREKGSYEGILRVIDQKGRTVMKRSIEGHYPFKERIDLSGTASGVHFLKWKDANGSYVRRFVVR